MTTLEFVNQLKEDYQKRQSIQEQANKKNSYKDNKIQLIHENIQNERKNKAIFLQNIKRSLLKEAILHIYDGALPKTITKNNKAIQESLVNEFIEKEGVNTILSRFKNSSYVLAEYANIVEKYTHEFIEEANKTKNYTNLDNLETKDKFYDELDFDSVEDVENAIRERVSSSIDDFIVSNADDKMKIKECLNKTQDKINKTANKEIQESFEFDSKKAIQKIRKRPKNIIEAMIYNISNSVYKNKQLNEMYCNDKKLNMDTIVENCETMYTFLEMLNTAKMKKIDNVFLEEFLDNLKA